MDDRSPAAMPVSPDYIQQWIHQTQQFHALQAQYSGYHQHYSYPPTEGAMASAQSSVEQPPPLHPQNPQNHKNLQNQNVPVPPEQQGAADISKPPPKKRGRPAQPKEPKEPKPPKIPKVPKAPKAPKAPKPPKDPSAPKAKPGPKPKKAKAAEEGAEGNAVDESPKKVRRKVDRFKGMSEEEVMKKTLPDLLDYNLDYVIIGINPGLMAAFIGRWFPGPGNHFWKCLFLSGFTDEQLNHTHDTVLPQKYKMGFTNMVARATPGSKDLSSKELREGGTILVEKLKKYKPLIAVFNGKCIYEMFCRELFGKKPKTLTFGLQPHKIPECDVALYLMPSSSARCAQFPRAQDKVHFYIKLRELRDKLKGERKSSEVEEVTYSFNLQLAKEDAKRMAIKEEQYDPGYEDAYGGAYGEGKGGPGEGGPGEGGPGEGGPGEGGGKGGPGGGPGGEGGLSNGHCTFNKTTEPSSASSSQPHSAAAQFPDGQWMNQTFTDQIPDISSAPTPGGAV
ncbi:G/T mismatch-specific thymine DNA glycosylase-like [Eucyclogobius newberryi]|uniref:G/T mismatch-specific thymine DNA glycosylase-like n=1 Tax=Eucyclogobius newberryi TaxID=166745 RepID=UPI003B5C5F74